MGTLWMQMQMQRMCPSLQNLSNLQGDSPTAMAREWGPRIQNRSVGVYTTPMFVWFVNVCDT